MESKEEVMSVASRKKRAQQIERITTAFTILLLILPYVFCGILAVRIVKLERQLDELQTDTHKSLEIVWEDMDGVAEKETGNEDVIFEEEEIPEQEITEDAKKVKKVYLTFDDGPSVYTREILDILKRYNVKATFFVTGMNESKYDERLQEIVDEGHSLGIHTYSHVYSEVYKSLEDFKYDFNKIRDYIMEHTGEDVKLYRFPGGSGNGVVSYETREQIMDWLEEEGIIYFDWNVSSGDGGSAIQEPEAIAERCIEGIKTRNTAIVLLHDASGKKNTVEALPLIIEGINQLEDTVLLPMDEETVAIQQISRE